MVKEVVFYIFNRRMIIDNLKNRTNYTECFLVLYKKNIAVKIKINEVIVFKIMSV